MWDQIRYGFIGTVPDLWFLKARGPASCKIRPETPNVAYFSKSQRYEIPGSTYGLTSTQWEETPVEDGQPLTGRIRGRRGR